MSRRCTDQNAQYANAGRPCHPDLQIVVEHKLQRCELVQGRHQSILVLDHEHCQILSGRTVCAGAPAANVTCHAHHRHFSLSMNRTSRQLKQQHSQCTTSTSTRFLSSCFYFHINLYSYTCSMLVMNLLSFIVDNHFTLSNQISALTKSILFTYS